jgi:hypothetical protein
LPDWESDVPDPPDGLPGLENRLPHLKNKLPGQQSYWNEIIVATRVHSHAETT